MTTTTTSSTSWSSSTGFGQSIKHSWLSFDNTDLTITDQTIFTGFQHHYTTGYGFNSTTPKGILGNCYHEPAVYHQDTDGEPTQEQLYLMITRCGKEASTHSSTQLPTVSPNSRGKQSVISITEHFVRPSLSDLYYHPESFLVLFHRSRFPVQQTTPRAAFRIYVFNLLTSWYLLATLIQCQNGLPPPLTNHNSATLTRPWKLPSSTFTFIWPAITMFYIIWIIASSRRTLGEWLITSEHNKTFGSLSNRLQIFYKGNYSNILVTYLNTIPWAYPPVRWWNESTTYWTASMMKYPVNNTWAAAWNLQCFYAIGYWKMWKTLHRSYPGWLDDTVFLETRNSCSKKSVHFLIQ